MAYLEPTPNGGCPSRNYSVVFSFGGRIWKKSTGSKDRVFADACLARVRENLRLAGIGRLDVPAGADVAAFMMSDGKLQGEPRVTESPTITELVRQYKASLPTDSLESETIRILTIHMRHFERILGTRFRINRLTQQNLQRYVNERSQQQGIRGKKVSTATIKKELDTFRTIWSWAGVQGYVTGSFPSKGLRFPKTTAKPHFQTFAEIEHKIATGDLSVQEQADLWDVLYLDRSELEDVLQIINARSRYAFLYPMAVMAAYTGARRSELVRSVVNDFDFDHGVVVVHEKKRVPGQRTTRRIPICGALRHVMIDWLSRKRQSIATFPAEHRTSRVRRSRQIDSVTSDEASDHLKRTLKGTKWHCIRGWHIFRHTFISLCAAQGTDQRLIDEWVGHQTDAMRRRYRHLFPNVQKAAIEDVFAAIRVAPDAHSDETR